MGALRLAIRNLTRRRTRATLTTLSIALSLAAFVSMISVTEAINYGTFTAVPYEYIGYNAGFPYYADIVVREANDFLWGGIRLSIIPSSLLKQISELEGVDYIAPRIGEFPCILRGAELANSSGVFPLPSRLVTFLGIEPAVEAKLRPLVSRIVQGSYLDSGDFGKALIGRGLVEVLNIRLGDTILIPSGIEGQIGSATVQAMKLTVKGIFETSDPDNSGFIYTTIETMRNLLGFPEDSVSQVAIRVKQPFAENLRKVAVDVAGLPNSNPLIPALTRRGVVELAVKTVQITNLQILSISLIVAALVTANAVVISIFERIKEIGVMTVVGAESWDTMAVFVYETSLIGVMGGIFGYIISVLAIIVYNSFLATALNLPVVPPKLNLLWFFVSVSLGIAVALVSSLLPSRVAATKEPIEILYRELGQAKGGMIFAGLAERSYVAALGLRNIARRKLRSILTSMGISVGIALLVSLLLASAGLVEALKVLGLITTGVEPYHYVVAIVSLIVGGIGTTNAMLTSVLERTKEIGIKMAIGSSSGKIIKEVLVESSLLGFIGGVIGVAAGLLISLIPQFMLIRTSLPFSFWLYAFATILGSLCFAVLVSILAALYPAHRAAHMEPVEAFAYVW